MILEIATFDIKEQSQTAFINAFEEAKLVVSKSKGFLGLEFQHCIEIPTKFVVNTMGNTGRPNHWLQGISFIYPMESYFVSPFSKSAHCRTFSNHQ